MKWGIQKYLKVSPGNSRLHKYSHWSQKAAAHLKPTLHLHTVKAHIMQNIVLQRALHPLTPEKYLFTRMPLCHHQHILPPAACTLLFTQRQQEVSACCLVLDGKLFGGETKSAMFCSSDRCWLDLSISTSPLLSLIGNKIWTLSAFTIYRQELLGGRSEHHPCKGKAAVHFTKRKIFFSLGVSGREMHFWGYGFSVISFFLKCHFYCVLDLFLLSFNIYQWMRHWKRQHWWDRGIKPQ